MASPSNLVFPSPPTSWPLPPPPPSSAPAASSEKKETFLFELKFKQVRLLQQALRSLVLTATCPEDLPLVGTGMIRDSGHFYILTGDVNLVARTILPPAVDTCLALSRFATIDVPAGLVLRLNLRRLEEKMDSTIVGNGEGLTLCLKGEKATEIVYSLKDENDTAVHISVIPVISTSVGDQIGSYWSGLENRFVLSFEISVDTLTGVMSFNGSPVHIKVTKKAVVFQVDNNIVFLRQRARQYRILRRSQDFPFRMEFNFHPRDAILNAVTLSNVVLFHLTSDSRCVLEIFVNGVGSIHFFFNAN